MLNLQSERNPRTFSFKLQRIDTERAKLENDIKKIFYKTGCPKLNIPIEDLLGERDLPFQDAVIVRKKVEEFILASGKEN